MINKGCVRRNMQRYLCKVYITKIQTLFGSKNTFNDWRRSSFHEGWKQLITFKWRTWRRQQASGGEADSPATWSHLDSSKTVTEGRNTSINDWSQKVKLPNTEAHELLHTAELAHRPCRRYELVLAMTTRCITFLHETSTTCQKIVLPSARRST